MFVNSHAKREDPRVDALLEERAGDDGGAYAVRLRLGQQASEPMTFGYREVADGKGQLAWCAELARRVRSGARALCDRSRSAHVGVR